VTSNEIEASAFSMSHHLENSRASLELEHLKDRWNGDVPDVPFDIEPLLATYGRRTVFVSADAFRHPHERDDLRRDGGSTDPLADAGIGTCGISSHFPAQIVALSDQYDRRACEAVARPHPPGEREAVAVWQVERADDRARWLHVSGFEGGLRIVVSGNAVSAREKDVMKLLRALLERADDEHPSAFRGRTGPKILHRPVSMSRVRGASRVCEAP
jgi:hypothetical protein